MPKSKAVAQDTTAAQRVDEQIAVAQRGVQQAERAFNEESLELSARPDDPAVHAALAALKVKVLAARDKVENLQASKANATERDTADAKVAALKDLKAAAAEFPCALTAVLDAQAQKVSAVNALADAESAEATAISAAKRMGWQILRTAYRDSSNPKQAEHAAGVLALIGRSSKSPHAAEATIERAVAAFEFYVTGKAPRPKFAAGTTVEIDGKAVTLVSQDGNSGVFVKAVEPGFYNGIRRRVGSVFHVPVTSPEAGLPGWTTLESPAKEPAKADEEDLV